MAWVWVLSFIFFTSGNLKLRFVQAGIHAAVFQKIPVLSSFDDPAVLHHQNLIC